MASGPSGLHSTMPEPCEAVSAVASAGAFIFRKRVPGSYLISCRAASLESGGERLPLRNVKTESRQRERDRFTGLTTDRGQPGGPPVVKQR